VVKDSLSGGCFALYQTQHQFEACHRGGPVSISGESMSVYGGQSGTGTCFLRVLRFYIVQDHFGFV
jgi:hypothetical protein